MFIMESDIVEPGLSLNIDDDHVNILKNNCFETIVNNDLSAWKNLFGSFIDENKWIHLDIAGPARSDNRKGATGFGVLSLYEFFKSISTDLPEN